MSVFRNGGALPACTPRPSGGSSDPEGRAMSIVQHLEMIDRAPLQTLDAMSRAVWTDHAASRLADAEAQALAEAIEARRRALKRPVAALSAPRVVVVRESA